MTGLQSVRRTTATGEEIFPAGKVGGRQAARQKELPHWVFLNVG